MSVESLPVYPSLQSLSQEEIQIIEQKCRLTGHLGDESLLQRIEEDSVILGNNGLTKEDIYKNHRNMNIKFNKLNTFKAFTTKNHGDHHKNLMISMILRCKCLKRV